MTKTAYCGGATRGGTRRVTKILLVMRLTALLLTAAFINVSAKGISQNITFSARSVPLEKVFGEIKRQTGYSVLYSQAGLANSTPVSLNVKDMPLADFLTLLFKNQPYKYAIESHTIIVAPTAVNVSAASPGAAADSSRQMQQVVPPGTVKGFVRTAGGSPLAGAYILVKGSNYGTIANANGSFSISAKEGDVLLISFVGYTTMEYKVTSAMVKPPESQPTIILKELVNVLDQTVVTAYGTTTLRLNTSSMVTVTAKQIETQLVMNPTLALRGLVPGLVVTPTAGYASSPVKLEVRGRNNINPLVSSEPMILIDGMPITNINLDGSDQSNGQNILPVLTQYQIDGTPSGGQSPLFGLNPLDIASITVLKDADATAIYGSRGANGVILITTKKGKTGPPQFTVNVSQGISRNIRQYKLLNIQQYVQLRREALQNDGLPLTKEFAPELTVWDTTRNVDWQKELWGGTGQVTNLNAGMSGSSGNSSFRVNGGYTRQTEILTTKGGNKSANLAVSLENHTPNQRFSIALQGLYTYTFTDEVNQSGLATTLAPNTPPMFDSTGALNYADWNKAGLNYSFPFGALLQRSKTGGKGLNSNLTMKYKLIKGLEISSSFAYNNQSSNATSIVPVASQNPAAYNPTGTANFVLAERGGWSIEPQINYSEMLGPGKLSVLLGSTIQSSYSKYNVAYGQGYTNDELINTILSAPQQNAYDASGQYKYNAVFGKINYNLFNKYILNLSGRRDGSSRFGPGFQFGNFGSVGAAWNLSDEKWVKAILPDFISFLKLRGSYGLTGSDGVGDYQYLSQWSSGSVNSLVPSYNGVVRPLVSQHAVNQYFRWQSNKSMNQGLEMSFFKDSRLTLQIDHYRNRISNQLLSYPTAIFTGFPSVTANWPATVQNTGWEFALTGRVINGKDFTWSAGFNISMNRNKLQDYPNIANSPYYASYVVGQPLSTSYVYHYLGIDPRNGMYSFKDYNHDGYLQGNQAVSAPPMSDNSDNRIAIDLTPRFTGGFYSQFAYKGLNLGLLFDFKKQMGRNAYAVNGLPGGVNHNIPLDIYNGRWTKPGDHAIFPAASTGTSATITGSNYFSASDGVYTDASFCRLSNVSISYSLPAKLTKKAAISGCNVFVNAQSLFVITKYKGVDPEVQSFNQMPQPRVVVAGISFNF